MQPCRSKTLGGMTDLRRLPVFQQGARIPDVYCAAWEAQDENPEGRILEMAEIAHVLTVDGFPPRQVWQRLEIVHPPAPDIDWLCSRSAGLREYVYANLAVHCPNYLALGPPLLNSALLLAELWAAHATADSQKADWPEPGMIQWPPMFQQQVRIRFTDAEPTAQDILNDQIDELIGRREFMELLELLSERNPINGSHYRRMRARIVPGDRILRFGADGYPYPALLGTSGYVLVRNDRPIDHVVTNCNHRGLSGP